MVMTYLEPIVTQCNLYADNWSYYTNHPTAHREAMKCLMTISASLSLQIDWTKTWGFATDKLHKVAIKRAKTELLPAEVPLSLVNKAKDPGYVVHYRNVQARGPPKERHQLAMKRFLKLRRSGVDIRTKAQIAHAACLVKALWGAYLYCCGQKYLDTLRSAIADAYLGAHHNIQSHIAVFALTDACPDPELYIIWEAIMHAREFLVQSTHSQAQLFFHIASHASRKPHQVMGPASALAWYRENRMVHQQAR